MAIPFLNNLNLNDNQLLNAKVQVASTAPTAAKGQIYLDSTANVNTLKYHDGTEWIGLKQLNINNSDFIRLEDINTSDNRISLLASLSASGTPDETVYLRGDNTWSPITGIYSFFVSDGTTQSEVLTQDVVTFSAVANETTVTQLDNTITIGLPNNVTLAGTLTSQGTGRSSFVGQVTIPETPLVATDAASKGYVDASVAGAVIFQGGYNAATNTPNLDSPPTGTIKRGFMWTVTTDGLFFTEQVRIGDSVIAKIDTPTTLADWTVTQNNIDLATLTTVGIGNVNAGEGIEVTYLNGTATVTALAASFTNTGPATTSTVYTIPASTHGLGNDSSIIMVQLVAGINNETVYADVARGANGLIQITFAAAQTANSVRALLQKIG